MAWNPEPEVAVARDAAKRLGEIAHAKVDRCIVIYTLDDERIGVASYGADRQLCSQARHLANRLYDETVKALS